MKIYTYIPMAAEKIAKNSGILAYADHKRIYKKLPQNGFGIPI